MTEPVNTMNGAEALVQTLIDSGIDTCFANPGTSEMHFVAALDKLGGMRCVLGLFEGVVTGAADGYYRMADKPAATLLHLGPGLGNGLANLHNAKKAHSGIVNIIGEHASYHIKHDAPLTADIEGIAGPVSHWVKTGTSATGIAQLGAEAVAAAATYPGQVASLILPANTAWETSEGPVASMEPAAPQQVSDDTINHIAKVLTCGEPVAMIMTGHCLREEPLTVAAKIAQKTNATLLGQTSNARLARGAGRTPLTCVPYAVDAALKTLAGFKHIICVGAKAPVAFFAYPDKPSRLWPEQCEVHTLCTIEQDSTAALEALAHELNAQNITPVVQERLKLALPKQGSLDHKNIATIISALLPENAIVADEGITVSRDLPVPTAGAAPHDWLQICGGSIGLGFPLATGAAVACPDRPVVAIQADGSGMYTLQALWTQARENLNVTTVLLSNRAYAILKHELRNVGANAGSVATDMMELNRPDLDWVALANGMGVPAAKASDTTTLIREFKAALASEGPYLIEAIF